MFLASKLRWRRLMYAPRWPEFAVSWHLMAARRLYAWPRLASRVPVPRTLQRRLFQPRQQVRRQGYPRPGLVQYPRPATLLMVRVC